MAKRANRVGEKSVSNSGLTMEIVRYRNAGDVDVKFSDGYVAKHRAYYNFKVGTIAHPDYPKNINMRKIRIGEKNMSNYGMEMEIIDYRDSGDIDIRFADGYIARNKTYENFKKGTISNKNLRSHNFKDKTGDKVIALNGQEMEIICYRNADDLDVKFSDGTVVCHKTYKNFKTGKIKNPNFTYIKPVKTEHLGEKTIARNGQEMEIVGYRKANDLDVKFSDGTIVYHKAYVNFVRGLIANPNNLNRYKTPVKTDRIGEKGVAYDGEEIEIIAYRGATDIDVKFADNTIIEHVRYTSFKNGSIKKEGKAYQNKRVVEKGKEVLGEKVIATNGQEMEIIEYRGYHDIDVRFSDGTVVCHKNYDWFKQGKIANPNCIAEKKGCPKKMSRVGEKYTLKSGEEVTIIAYRDCHDIDIKFSDGEVVEHISFNSVKQGYAKRPSINCQLNKQQKRIREKSVANCGMGMEIIAYRNCNDIDIKFDDGVIVTNKTYASFKRGSIRNLKKVTRSAYE